MLHEPGELSGWLNRAAASLVGFLSDASSPAKDIPPCVSAELGVFHESEGKDNGLNLAFSLDLFGVRCCSLSPDPSPLQTRQDELSPLFRLFFFLPVSLSCTARGCAGALRSLIVPPMPGRHVTGGYPR